jgi:hypothetical protein
MPYRRLCSVRYGCFPSILPSLKHSFWRVSILHILFAHFIAGDLYTWQPIFYNLIFRIKVIQITQSLLAHMITSLDYQKQALNKEAAILCFFLSNFIIEYNRLPELELPPSNF